MDAAEDFLKTEQVFKILSTMRRYIGWWTKQLSVGITRVSKISSFAIVFLHNKTEHFENIYKIYFFT